MARTEAYLNLESLRLLEEQYFAENAAYAPTRGVAGANQPGKIALIQAAGGFATGNTGTRVTSDVFAIDCNNNKNF